MIRRSHWLPFACFAAAATYLLWRLADASHLMATRSYDIYSYFYPVVVQIVRAVQAGGSGLWWNPFQSCGQPLFGGGTTGILYPPVWLALALPPDTVVYAVLFFNLMVGCISMYLLARELGTGAVAAWCGGLAFGFSNTGVDLITFTPLVSGPYAWMPAAMLFCERILRAPTLRRGMALGVAVGLALIPGHPQVVLYLYQIIALRAAWEFATHRGSFSGRTVAMLALGLVLAPLLVAVQFFPALQVMHASVRGAALKSSEVWQRPFLSWEGIRGLLARRAEINNPFVLLPCALAGAAWLKAGQRRHATFYAAIGVITFILSLGSNGPLFNFYSELPLGTLFRDPARFLWVTSFCTAVLVALGTEAILSAGRAGTGYVQRALAVALPAVDLIGFAWLSPNGLFDQERAIAVVALAACVLAVVVPLWWRVAALTLAAVLAVNLLQLRPIPFRHLLPSGEILFARRDAFAALRERMTAHDRVYLVVPEHDFSFQQKTASLFGVPAIFDYEAQPTRRYAAFFTMLRKGKPGGDLNDWLYPIGGWLGGGFTRRLLNLTAARYLVVGASVDGTAALKDPPLQLVSSTDDLRVYENTAALPRALFVPRVEVVADERDVLRRLAFGKDALRDVALIEEAPASGFLGERAPIEGARVDFARNDAEDIALRVQAPRRGFVFLADQYAAGWSATVNGATVPILLADYAFRLVEVPAGDSMVEFHYAPIMLRIGAVVSLLSWCAVGALLWFSRSARHPFPAVLRNAA